MDLKQPVEYRGYDLNGRWRSDGGRIYGCQINSINYSNVPSAGYTEKRALDDGRDASDIFMDARRIAVTGQVWGETRGELFDELQAVLNTLSPTLAYNADPVSKGYLPLTFSQPSANAFNFPDGTVNLLMFVRPIALPEFIIDRDRTGGEDTKGGTVLWTAALEAKDPRKYIDPAIATTLAAGASGEGTLENRGDNYTPINVHLEVDSSKGAGTWTLLLAGSQLRITIPNSANDQQLDYDGARKLLYLTENGVTTLRMDLLTLLFGTAHPRVSPGGSEFSWSSTITLDASPASYIQHREAFV